MDPMFEDHYGSTALHAACVGGCMEVTEFLAVELAKYNPIKKVMSDLKNKWSNSPLHTAALNGHLNLVQFFISNQNCDPNILGEYVEPPFTLLLCSIILT